jgi:hypothetical protein
MYISKKPYYEMEEELSKEEIEVARLAEEDYDWLEESSVEAATYDPIGDCILEQQGGYRRHDQAEDEDDEEMDSELVELAQEWEGFSQAVVIACIPSTKLILALGRDVLPALVKKSSEVALKAIEKFEGEN